MHSTNISNDLSHASIKGDLTPLSKDLIIKSQIANLIPNHSIDYKLCFKSSSGNATQLQIFNFQGLFQCLKMTQFGQSLIFQTLFQSYGTLNWDSNFLKVGMHLKVLYTPCNPTHFLLTKGVCLVHLLFWFFFDLFPFCFILILVMS